MGGMTLQPENRSVLPNLLGPQQTYQIKGINGRKRKLSKLLLNHGLCGIYLSKDRHKLRFNAVTAGSVLLCAHPRQWNIPYLMCWTNTMNTTFDNTIYCTPILDLWILAGLNFLIKFDQRMQGKLHQVETGKTIKVFIPSLWRVMQNTLERNQSNGQIYHFLNWERQIPRVKLWKSLIHWYLSWISV